MEHKPVKVIHCNSCEKKFESEDNAKDHYSTNHSLLVTFGKGFTVEWV